MDANEHPKSGRGRVALLRLSAIVLIGAIGYAGAPTFTAGQDAPAGIVAAPIPDITAQSIFVEDVTAGLELMSLNPDTRLPPASTVKMATALVVVDNVELSEVVVFDAADTAGSDESAMGLIAGDELTVEDLLHGLLIPSGNDAARSLARYVGASLLARDGTNGDPIDRFVVAMNAYAESLGLQNTNFTNPAGLDDPEMYSSARDLATIAQELLSRKTLSTIVKTESHVVTLGGFQPREIPMQNKNQLLGQDGIHGVKTGTTDKGASLVIAKWEHGRNRVIGVILGSDIKYDEQGFQVPESDRRYDDMAAVLSSIEQAFLWVDLSAPEEVPGLAEELDAWQVALDSGASLIVPNSGDGPFRYQLELEPESIEQEIAGRVLFFVGSTAIAERPVVQQSDPDSTD